MDEIRVLSAGSNWDFSGGRSAKYLLYYQLWLRNQLNSLLIAITTVQDCSPIFPQGGQGKRVWLTVREPSMKAGWRDAPLALRDLAVSNIHVHIVIFTLLLLSKEIVKILYNEKTDSIWEWHILATFVYLHNGCYYRKKYIQFFADVF